MISHLSRIMTIAPLILLFSAATEGQGRAESSPPLAANTLTEKADSDKSLQTSPVPIDPEDWLSDGDYPQSLTAENIKGKVKFRLSVDIHGVAIDCQIIESSGSTLLDSATCAYLKARAHFNPARDAGGNPTYGFYKSAVQWSPPASIPASKNNWVSLDDYPVKALSNHWTGTSYWSVTVGIDGRAKDCIILQSSGHQILDTAACNSVLRHARFSPEKDEHGQVIEGRYNNATAWRMP